MQLIKKKILQNSIEALQTNLDRERTENAESIHVLTQLLSPVPPFSFNLSVPIFIPLLSSVDFLISAQLFLLH